MANIDLIRGRQVVAFLTNKSGGAVIAGDVVIMDGSNDESFTTTTSASSLSKVGVAQESIANNAQGRVLTAGYASLVNVNASATRAYFLFTHTVAKQATSSATFAAGAFGRVIKAGTSPSALIYDETAQTAGSFTDPMTTRGDIIVRNASNVAARLAIGAAGTVLGGGTDVAYAFPPGYEFAYNEFSADVTTTATTEGTATTVVTSSAVTYDGSTIVRIEFYCPNLLPPTADGGIATLLLYEDSTVLGRIGQARSSSAGTAIWAPCTVSRRRTPSNASHTYTIKIYTSSGTANASAGAGGSGTNLPGFIRVTKAA